MGVSGDQQGCLDESLVSCSMSSQLSSRRSSRLQILLYMSDERVAIALFHNLFFFYLAVLFDLTNEN